MHKILTWKLIFGRNQLISSAAKKHKSKKSRSAPSPPPVAVVDAGVVPDQAHPADPHPPAETDAPPRNKVHKFDRIARKRRCNATFTEEQSMWIVENWKFCNCSQTEVRRKFRLAFNVSPRKLPKAWAFQREYLNFKRTKSAAHLVPGHKGPCMNDVHTEGQGVGPSGTLIWVVLMHVGYWITSCASRTAEFSVRRGCAVRRC